MAMLAEPRQRKRYHLNPKGKALYEDDSRFGTKMLEKMGWKKGEGLGARSEGSKDFIRIRYKNDCLGLGFEHRDDQWTQHEQSFNGLLKSLNNEGDDTYIKEKGYEDEMPSRVGFGFQNVSAKGNPRTESEKLKENISGISLEERSKQSKARVHYKKFTKGKDLAQYSEKDLANIFGKKVADEQQINGFYTNLTNTFGVITEEANSGNSTANGVEHGLTKKRDKKKEKDHSEGEKELQGGKANSVQPQTFTSSLSVQDYFKIKMQAIKNKNIVPYNSEQVLDNMNNTCNDEFEAGSKKKNKNKKETQDLQNSCLQAPAEKKLKKNLKNYKEDLFGNKIENEANFVEKGKCNIEETGEIILTETKTEMKGILNNCLQDCAAKTSRKTKSKTERETKDQNIVQEPVEKKSKKNKNTADQNIVLGNSKEPQTVNKAKKFKRRDTTEPAEFKLDESNSHITDNDCIRQPAEKKLKRTKNSRDRTKLFDLGDPEVGDNVMNFKENVTKHDGDISPERKPRKKKSKNRTKDDERNFEESNINNANTADVIALETEFEQESGTKKKNKLKKEPVEAIEIIDIDKDETTNTEIPTIKEEKEDKKKCKKSKVEETSAHEKILTAFNSKNLQTAKYISEGDPQVNDLEELKKQYQAFNIYPISSFCAEKFRNINLNKFEGSTLPHLEGYGLCSDIQLEIKVNKNDEERILNLWKNSLNKYEQTGKPKKSYRTYIQSSISALKTKQKPPKFNIKTWQRRNAFQL